MPKPVACWRDAKAGGVLEGSRSLGKVYSKSIPQLLILWRDAKASLVTGQRPPADRTEVPW